MIEQLKVGDKLTVIKVNSLAATSINRIMIDSIQDGKAVFTVKRKKYYLSVDNNVLVLRGHNLGITQGTWNNGGSCLIMSGNCNLGGMDRESMIELLKTNINPLFDQWQRIYWFDGKSEEGDPIFVPRPVTAHYLQYQAEAEQNINKTAQQINLNDFIYSYRNGSKHQSLNDMLKWHLREDLAAKEHLKLGKVVDIIEMSEEAFDALCYGDHEFKLNHSGGDRSDDISEDRQDVHNYSQYEIETFYTLYTLIRTPSGRAITVDAQGYDYMRYTGLLPHYKTSMAADCAKATAILTKAQNEEAEEKQTQKAEAERRYQQECKRVAKDYPFLTVTVDKYDQKVAANNLRVLLKRKFSETKFSVKKYYYDSYTVSWVDGPTVGQVTEITRLFRNEGFDGMTDSSYPIITPFNERYGGIGSISAERKVSEHYKEAELELINVELGKSYQMRDFSPEYGDNVGTIIHQRLYKKDFTPTPEPKVKCTSKAKPAVEAIQTEGVEIVDYSEKSFAIIGDTKPIKETLKQLGGCFNGRLSCGAGWIFSKTKLDTVKQTLLLT
ncbi:hypothetical protein BN938_1801 [Mucinivorans hirudinis]|uniref:Large polyvalent protein associated domain-containing protein n=1 Tax=Mucinivorans hirudinis TaxID=1433126 RepID=A0A060R8M2_9BACT|nr:hypothetical protein BN938_1801 [Mucinivorans hirudinis]